jgi:hypothetical protein
VKRRTLISRLVAFVLSITFVLLVPTSTFACDLKWEICKQVETSYYNQCREAGQAPLACLAGADAEFRRCYYSRQGCNPY